MTTQQRTHLGFILSLSLSGLFLFACGSSQKAITAEELAKKTTSPMPMHGTMTAKRGKGGAMRFDVEYRVPRDTNNPVFNLLFNTTDCYIVIRDSERGVLDTMDVHVSLGTTSMTLENDTIFVGAGGSWLNPLSQEFNTIIYEVVLTSQRKEYHDFFSFDLSPKNDNEKSYPLLQVVADLDHQADTAITFAMAAKRIRGEMADYFPNSERLHVDILDESGKVIFNSSQGVNFLQEVGVVEPTKRGQIKRFTYTWTGRTSSGTIAPAGKYTARLILPTKPESYTQTLPFEWTPPKH